MLASTGKNLLLFNLGLAVAFPTILIPALRGLQPERYAPSDALHFSVAQASWFGSLAYILKPCGSAASGWVTERIGRKRAMLLVNVPHIVGWPMLYFAQSVEMVFAAAVLLGLGVGFMEAPVVTYVGEIWYVFRSGKTIGLLHDDGRKDSYINPVYNDSAHRVDRVELR